MSREAVARVVGQAMVDKSFAVAVTKNPQKAAQTLGVHLGKNEVAALKDIKLAQLDNVAAVIRNKLGPVALLDQQQQQQARMD